MKYIIYLFLCLLLYSCSDTQLTEIETIKLDQDVANYPTIDDSKISVDYEILTLKNRDKSQIVPSIEKLIEFDGRLYILPSLIMPNTSLYIFGSDGSLIKRLNSGRGRGEFMSAIDMCIDAETKQLEVLDRMQCAILRYTLDGEFVSKSDLPRKNMSNFYKLADSQYLIYTPFHVFKEETDSYFKRVVDGEIVQEYLNKPRDLVNGLLSSHIYKGNDGVYCNGEDGNTLYKFDEETMSFEPSLQIEPILDVDDPRLADKGMPENELSCFCNFRRFGNIINLYVRRGSRYHTVMYDTKSRRSYNHILPNFSFKFIGANEREELYSIHVESVEALREYTPKSKIERSIIEDLLSRDLLIDNPYIIRLSYGLN